MKRFLVALSLVLFSLNLKAQTFEESMRYWSDGPLVWDDLTLKSPRDFRTCELSFRWMAQEEKTCPAWNTFQVTGATQFQVSLCYPEAIVRLTHYIEALSCFRR